jgi:hypothetical protein
MEINISFKSGIGKHQKNNLKMTNTKKNARMKMGIL